MLHFPIIKREFNILDKKEPQLLVTGIAALVILCGAPCRLRYEVRLTGAAAIL